MVMTKGMHFSPEVWKKVTKAQKTEVYAFRKEKKTTAAFTTVTVNTSEIQPTHNPINTTIPPTPHTVMQANTDVCHLLSKNTYMDSNSLPSQSVIDGRTYTLSNCDRAYSIQQNMLGTCGSLIDGGANGGLSGSDVVILADTILTTNANGIANFTLQKVPVCTVDGRIQTQHGPIIGVFHQYAHHGTSKTIHSDSQLHDFGTIVDNTPCSFGGKQCLEVLDGFIIPLYIFSGLPYIYTCPATPIELDSYPHVLSTSDME
jgi:hypothetical protein